ncbi:MAG: DUF167 domain-containing protein [Candidatus Humimicrobiaceae bacterium]
MKTEIINLYVKPGSSINKIDGKYKDYIKIRIRAKPVRGKANKSLLEFLAKILAIPKSNISIISGQKSNYKKLSVKCADNTDILGKLQNNG